MQFIKPKFSDDELRTRLRLKSKNSQWKLKIRSEKHLNKINNGTIY